MRRHDDYGDCYGYHKHRRHYCRGDWHCYNNKMRMVLVLRVSHIIPMLRMPAVRGSIMLCQMREKPSSCSRPSD